MTTNPPAIARELLAIMPPMSKDPVEISNPRTYGRGSLGSKSVRQKKVDAERAANRAALLEIGRPASVREVANLRGITSWSLYRALQNDPEIMPMPKVNKVMLFWVRGQPTP